MQIHSSFLKFPESAVRSALDPHQRISHLRRFCFRLIDKFCRNAVRCAVTFLWAILRGPEQVVLKWRFDWAGPPRGLVERLIASCHEIGKVEQGLCWRYGAVVKSHLMRAAGGNGEKMIQ